MKNFNKIALLFLIPLFFSCSSNSSSEDSFEPYFEKSVNGESVSGGDEIRVYKFEDTFNVGYYPNTHLSFNSSGKFGFCSIELPIPNTNGTQKFYSFRGFSSHYFNLIIENLDEVNKRIKVSYSGYVYANPLDFNSEKKYVSGSFYQEYEELVPAVSGLGNNAKINGNDWVSTNKYSTRSPSAYSKITQHDFSDDEYKIMVNYDFSSTTVGTYNFNNSDITNKIQLAKYDVASETFINYECSGTLDITYKYNGTNNNRLFEGNYNFTAINPITNESVSVTNGSFKLTHGDF